MQGEFFFSFLPISLAVPGNQLPNKMRLSLSQPFPMPLKHEAMACTAPLQAAPTRLSLFLLWAITCWRKECGTGQGSLRALLTTPNSSERGGPQGGFLSGTPGAGRRGIFFFNCSFSIITFRRVRFTPCCFTEVGKCRGARHRKGGGGVGLATLWFLKPPAVGKAQRRCVGNKQSPGYHLLLLSSTQIARGCGGTKEV